MASTVTTHISFVKGRKAVSGELTAFQKRVMEFMCAKLIKKYADKDIKFVLNFSFQTDGKRVVKISRSSLRPEYTINLSSTGTTATDTIEHFGWAYGSINAYEQYGNWDRGIGQQYAFMFVEAHNEEYGKPAEVEDAALLGDVAPKSSQLTVEFFDGKTNVGVLGAAKRQLKRFDDIMAMISEEVDALRQMGVTDNIEVVFQLKPKARTTGSFHRVNSTTLAIEVQVTDGGYNGGRFATDAAHRSERAFSYITFVTKVMLGFVHQTALRPESKNWTGKSRDQWANSYAWMRGSNPRHFEGGNPNVRIVDIGVPTTLRKDASVKPTDLNDSQDPEKLKLAHENLLRLLEPAPKLGNLDDITITETPAPTGNRFGINPFTGKENKSE